MEQLANDLQLDLTSHSLPQTIAIEGSIGVGKTTLARRLAKTFNYNLLLEKAQENPFLEKFYQTGGKHALPSQLFFLFHHLQQLQSSRQTDMFNPSRVADFMVEKDPIFARATLDDDEYRLYHKVFEQLTIDTPAPDLVIYLQAPTDVLLQRIQRRGNPYERNISPDYLDHINRAFTDFFHYYSDSPLLIVNSAEINLADSVNDYRELVEFMLGVKSGRHYYNPRGL